MVCEVLGEKSAFIVVVRSVVFTRVIYRQAHAGVCLDFFSPPICLFYAYWLNKIKTCFFLFFLGSKLFYPMILCFEMPSSVLLFRFGIQNKEVVCTFACSFFFVCVCSLKKKVVGSRLLCLYLSILYFVFKSLLPSSFLRTVFFFSLLLLMQAISPCVGGRSSEIRGGWFLDFCLVVFRRASFPLNVFCCAMRLF